MRIAGAMVRATCGLLIGALLTTVCEYRAPGAGPSVRMPVEEIQASWTLPAGQTDNVNGRNNIPGGAVRKPELQSLPVIAEGTDPMR